MVLFRNILALLLIGLTVISTGTGQDAKELNENLDAFIKSFESTVESAMDIEKIVLQNVNQNDLLKMVDVNDLRINVNVFKHLLTQFKDFQSDISKGDINVPSPQYLSKLVILYKQVNMKRGEFAEFDERKILSGLVDSQKIKDQRELFNERSKEILAILVKVAKMEEKKQGSVLPGPDEKQFTLDKLTDNTKPVFKEITSTATKSIRIMEDIENIYTNLPNYVGSLSSAPFAHIANLFESASDVTDVLTKSAAVFLVDEKRKIIIKRALRWYNGADGYDELTTRLDLLKDLLLKITKYRDLQEWNNKKPKDFLDESLKRMQMVLDDRINIKKLINGL